MAELVRAGVALRYTDSGGGLPVLFQHGLGGDEAQVADVFPAGFRRLTLECRAQGGSEAGPFADLSIATFARDALALADARGVGAFVAGGISMGAAIGLRLAARHQQRVRALILVRPAWLFEAAPANMHPFAEVAGLLAQFPAGDAKRRYAASDGAAGLQAAAPDNLASLLGFFDRPDPARTAALLARIAADGPGITQAEAAALNIPALVIGCGIDAVHPFAYAERLAGVLPRASLVRVTPKAENRAAHAAEVREAIAAFLERIAP